MLVAVFGATGAIGQFTVQELLDNGHTVKALVRNPAKVPASWGSRVTILHGELHDASLVEQTIQGSEAVVSALGPSMGKSATGKPLVIGYQNILAAMKTHGVTRFIGHATPSFKDPLESATWVSRLIGFLGKTMFPRGYAEMIEMCDLVVNSGLEWTIVRFTNPVDKPKTGHVKAGFFGSDSIAWTCTRADIGMFTAAQIEDKRFIRRAPAIGK